MNLPDNPTYEDLKPFLAELSDEMRVTTLKCDQRTANGRVYTREVMQAALAKLNNPDAVPIYAHREVDSAFYNLTESGVVGAAFNFVLEPDGAVTANVYLCAPYNDFRSNKLLSFHTRGIGTIGEGGIIDDYELTGVDMEMFPHARPVVTGNGSEDPIHSLAGRGPEGA